MRRRPYSGSPDTIGPTVRGGTRVGVLQRFERRLEGLVGTAFARLFKGQVEPVEVAKALQREAELKRSIIGQDRVLVPNRYVVELGPSDHERLAPWESQLANT